jgi:hypothetical protein
VEQLLPRIEEDILCDFLQTLLAAPWSGQLSMLAAALHHHPPFLQTLVTLAANGSCNACSVLVGIITGGCDTPTALREAFTAGLGARGAGALLDAAISSLEGREAEAVVEVLTCMSWVEYHCFIERGREGEVQWACAVLGYLGQLTTVLSQRGGLRLQWLRLISSVMGCIFSTESVLAVVGSGVISVLVALYLDVASSDLMRCAVAAFADSLTSRGCHPLILQEMQQQLQLQLGQRPCSSGFGCSGASLDRLVLALYPSVTTTTSDTQGESSEGESESGEEGEETLEMGVGGVLVLEEQCSLQANLSRCQGELHDMLFSDLCPCLPSHMLSCSGSTWPWTYYITAPGRS